MEPYSSSTLLSLFSEVVNSDPNRIAPMTLDQAKIKMADIHWKAYVAQVHELHTPEAKVSLIRKFGQIWEAAMKKIGKIYKVEMDTEGWIKALAKYSPESLQKAYPGRTIKT